MAAAPPPSFVVQDLSQHLVPAEETECGEYVYRMPLKLEEHVTKQKKGQKGQKRTHDDNLKKEVKYKYNTGENLVKIISALLNTSGGVIQLHPCIPQVHFRGKEFEEWRNNFKNTLNFVSRDVRNRCVTLEWEKEHGLAYIFVHKSREFATANSYLHTRDSTAQNTQVTKFQFIKQVMNQQTTSRDFSLPLTGPFIIGDKCMEPESQSLEFKYCKNATTAQQLIQQINSNNQWKALFAMANLSGGGDVVIGVKEDTETREHHYIGQHLCELEKEQFKRKLQELLEQDTDGKRRIWGDTTTVPTEGTHWSCQFIPVQTATQSGIASQSGTQQPRQVLIHIHMFHCPGGAFLKKPEAFTVNDDGYIEELMFDEWATRYRTAVLVSPTVAPPGALPRGAAPPGAVPPGAAPPGAVPPGAAPPGAAPHGAVLPGAVPLGVVPPGAVPSTAVPSGAVPPGAAPTGTVPPGTVPPGAVPSTAVPPGSVPPGAAPTGTVPPGAVPTGTVPTRAVPPGAVSPRAVPPGAVPLEAVPPGAVPPGAVPPGPVSPGPVPLEAVPPGAAPPGAVPSGAVPPGAVLPGAVPSGAVPPGAVPPGAVPPGAVPPGAVPLGAVLPGAVPSGAVPTGAVPLGAVPPGAVLPGAVPSGAVLPGAVPSGAVLPGAVPSGAVLTGALPLGAVPPGAVPPGAVPPEAVPLSVILPVPLPGPSVTEPLPQQPLLAPTAQARESLLEVTPRHVFRENHSLSYTEYSSTWVKGVEARPSLLTHPEVPDMFNTASPLRYNPSREVLQNILTNHAFPNVLNVIDHTTGNPGFGIAADSLFNCIKLFCTTLPAISNLIMDLLTVTEDAAMSIKAVSGHGAYTRTPNQVRNYNAYTVSLARIVKRRVLEAMATDQQYPLVQIRVSLLDESGNLKHTPDIFAKMFSDVKAMLSFESLCMALSNTLKGMNTCFRNLICRDEDLRLSVEQTRMLLDLNDSRFNVIEGPPGCGKTLLAQMYSMRKGEEACYISSSQALVSRARAKHIDAYFAEDSEKVVDLLENSLTQKQHIIIDDNHTYAYTYGQLHRICENIGKAKTLRKHLHVFQDSFYQSYHCKTQKRDKFGTYIFKHRRHYGTAMFKTLNEIHRNTQVVASFLKKQVASLLPENMTETVREVSSVRGDNVNIKQISNLRNYYSENGVLKHVESLLKSSVDSQGQHYTSRDVVILVDNKQPKKAREEKQIFLRIFKRTFPEVHDAATYPTRSITIDCVDNYIGLESRVVIFVMPKENRFDDEDANKRYRIAIASRGIDRVDFLQEQKLETSALQIYGMDYGLEDVVLCKAPVHVWSLEEEKNVRDVCWESEAKDAALLYITQNPSEEVSVRGENYVRRVSVMGETLPLSMDTTHMTRRLSVTCTRDGEWAVVMGRGSGSLWTAYRRQAAGVYQHHSTHTVDDGLSSARVTPEGCLAVLVQNYSYKGNQYVLRLYKGVSDPDMRWEKDVSFSVSPPPPGAMSVSSIGSIFLCHSKGVSPFGVVEHSATDGSHIRTVPYPAHLESIWAVCPDPSGRVWIGSGDGPVWLCDEKGGAKVIERPYSTIHSLALHGNRLAVAVRELGLHLYEV